MENYAKIINIYEDSFRVNIYTRDPFRMIGLVDARIRYTGGEERVILAYYRSSGTNSGKVKGLWYPIVGIKEYTGRFGEFTNYLNYIVTKTTKGGYAEKGWLVKSPFFSNGPQGTQLKKLSSIGKRLAYLYENGQYTILKEMDERYMNSVLTLDKKLYHNIRTQRVNYEELIHDVYENA